MERVVLGRTGLLVSRMGIGAGGPSQIGQKTGRTEDDSVDLLLRAFDAGVNLVDSSEAYSTEEIIGRALQIRDRGRFIISTKKSTRHQEVTPATLTESLDASLRRLGTDYIDIYNLHGVTPQDYRRLVEDVYPTLEALKRAGKIRFVGITEMFSEDLGHAMMQQALADDLWDVVMVGFNLLNQTARQVLQRTREANVGVQIMFAVRKALGDQEHLRDFVAALVKSGEIDPTEVNAQAPLDFVLANGEAVSIPDAAYRFCRDESGVHVVLSGTGNTEHLASNLESFGRPPLSPEATLRLQNIFRAVVSTTGQSLG